MAQIISVINQKGGTAKTTTTVNMAACLALKGNRVLLLDMDPQANATLYLGVDPMAVTKSIYHVLIHEEPLESILLSTGIPTMHLAPGSVDLSKTDINLADRDRKQYRLADALAPILSKYDYVFLDCPPSFGLLPVNALVASKKVIIPMVPQYFSLEGLKQIDISIKNIRQNLNPELDILGILFCVVNFQLRITQPSIDMVRQHFTDQVFNQAIRICSKLNESGLAGKSVFEYDAKSRAAVDYSLVVDEMLDKIKKETHPLNRLFS